MKNIINFILFQAGWFACILFAAKDKAWYGITIILAIVAIHVALTRPKLNEFRLYFYTVLIGLLFDTLMRGFELITYEDAISPHPIAPIWILSMWLLFAITIRHSLYWLNSYKIGQVMLGLIGGPLAYIAGEKIGAVTLYETSLYFLALGWGVITPALFYWDKK
jgi:hypothetical protein